MPLRPTLSSRRGARDGLVTPGGTDLLQIVNRNADKLDKLRALDSCCGHAGDAAGSSEALDQFLATFVAQSSQVGLVGDDGQGHALV